MTNAAAAIKTFDITTGDRFWHNGTRYVATGNAVAIIASVWVVIPVEGEEASLELHRAGHVLRA